MQPTIRTAAVDGRGHLWISFVIPYTYVYDGDGDKIRALQFRAAGIMAPNSLFFGKRDRLLVTPGLYEFEVPGAGRREEAGRAGGAGQAGRERPFVLRLPPISPLQPHDDP